MAIEAATPGRKLPLAGLLRDSRGSAKQAPSAPARLVYAVNDEQHGALVQRTFAVGERHAQAEPTFID